MPATMQGVFFLSREIEYRLSLANGGGDGPLRRDGDEADVTAEDTPSLSVVAGTFRGYIGKRFVGIGQEIVVGPVVPPVGGSPGDLRRIDLVQYTYGIGANIKTGVESGTPSVPSADSDSIEFSDLYLRNGMSVIKDADDSTNGYIVKSATFI